MKSNFKYILCAIYLSLGPLVWFSSFTLGPLKRLLLVLIIFSFVPFFINKKIAGVRSFIIISLCLTLSLWMNWGRHTDEIFNLVLGVIEEFIFFVIGYRLAQQNLLETNKSFNTFLLIIPIIGSLLTISNFITGVPSWIAPGQLDKYAEKASLGYEIEALWATGFSWGRNGWGCTLCLLLPFCLLLKTKAQSFSSWVILFFSILICGNRNGMLAGLLSLFAFLFLSKIIKKKYAIILFCSIGFMFLLLVAVSGTTDIVALLRLDDRENLTSGRLFQYALIPNMISEMGFWGLGHGGTTQYLYNHGLGEHALHMTYFKILIEYGWLVGLCLILIVIHSLKLSIRFLKSKNLSELALALVLLSGLAIATFEPEVVFGTLGGYAIWWFSYGYLLSNSVINRKKIYVQR